MLEPYEMTILTATRTPDGFILECIFRGRMFAGRLSLPRGRGRSAEELAAYMYLAGTVVTLAEDGMMIEVRDTGILPRIQVLAFPVSDWAAIAPPRDRAQEAAIILLGS